jgi:hypothetical protein
MRLIAVDFDYDNDNDNDNDNDKCAKRSSALLTGCKSRSGKG